MTTLSGIITPSNVETASSASTLTNKTINGSNNTITNVSLSTGVTGTLPVANGGTGTTSTQFANLTSNVTGTLPVANGGTGVAALTANNVLLGNGTSCARAKRQRAAKQRVNMGKRRACFIKRDDADSNTKWRGRVIC